MRSALAIGVLLAARPSLVELETWVELAGSAWNDGPPLVAWRRGVPEVRSVAIASSADGSRQPALFYDSGSEKKKPLLVVLHSWSTDWRHPFALPYARWAVEHDWAFIHPDYRGPNDGPQATASEASVQDVLDAVAWASAHADVDPDRIYLVGFSGGGMASLILAGRHPETWAAVVAWVPVFDLGRWYAEVVERHPRYAAEIRRSCGGAPLPGTAAAEECERRSPRRWLDGARRAGVPIYLAVGVDDPFVSPRHALDAFNVLAAPEDRLTEDACAGIAATRSLPVSLERPVADPVFDRARRRLLMVRRSGPVELRVFDGRHDVVYGADLHWLSERSRH